MIQPTYKVQQFSVSYPYNSRIENEIEMFISNYKNEYAVEVVSLSINKNPEKTAFPNIVLILYKLTPKEPIKYE